jgi:hypothetical protein
VTGQAFTELGLGLDIVGAILLYFFGLPQAGLVERENWIEEHYPRIARWCKYLGLPLLIFGFACQLIGTMQSG